MQPTLTVSPETVAAFAPLGGEAVITVTSNVEWAVAVDPAETSWISVAVADDNIDGTGTFKITVAKNKDLEARSAKVTVTAATLTKEIAISQEGAVATPRLLDSLVLVKIFNAAGGANNWKEDRIWDLENKPMNEWYNVKLNADGRVTQINIANGTILTDTWVLPEEVGNLTEMTNFRIVNGKLTGAIPESIYNMTKLQYYRFWYVRQVQKCNSGKRCSWKPWWRPKSYPRIQ